MYSAWCALTLLLAALGIGALRAVVESANRRCNAPSPLYRQYSGPRLSRYRNASRDSCRMIYPHPCPSPASLDLFGIQFRSSTMRRRSRLCLAEVHNTRPAPTGCPTAISRDQRC